MNTEPLIRVPISINRKDGTAEDLFHRYLPNVHAPMVQEWLLRCGGLKYVQYRKITTSQLKALAKNGGAASGKPALSYDGTADFWVGKYEDFKKMFLDAEYWEKIKADERNFIDVDVKSAVVAVGVEYIIIQEGKLFEKPSRSS